MCSIPDRLTNQQIVRFYKLRWGVEVEFRGLANLGPCEACAVATTRVSGELSWFHPAMGAGQLFSIKEHMLGRSASKSRSLEGGVWPDHACLTILPASWKFLDPGSAGGLGYPAC